MASTPSTDGPAVFGRQREQERLHAALERTFDGNGGLVLLSGEAGIGKTTLVQELGRAAVDRGALVLAGHCYDLTTTPPFGPWLEIVRASPRVEGLPSLREITSGGFDDGASPGRGDELFAWGLALFEKLAADRPLVLVLEDIHWDDRASLDFLRFLGRSIAGIPVLLVATYRGYEIESGHPLYILLPAIVRESNPERIDLQPLDDSAILAWLRSAYALAAADEQRLAAHLQQHADGNPFYAGEILRELEETGILHRLEGAWVLETLDNVGVPVLLRQVIEARLSRIEPEARAALAFASVIGQDVEIAIWQRLAELTDSEILNIAEQAVSVALVELSADGRRLAFRHALIRAALYEEILPLRRRTLHLRVAEALLTEDDPDPDALAHHLQQAGDSRAGEWLIKAGDRAYYRAYSLRTAISRYRAALATMFDEASERKGWLLVQLSQTMRYADPLQGIRYATDAEQIAINESNEPLRAVAVRNRGINLVYSGQDGFDDIYLGFEILDNLPDKDRAYLQAMLPGQRISPAQERREMPIWYSSRGRYHEAIESSEQSLTQLDPESASGPVHAAVIHWGAGLAYACLGRPDRARRALEISQEVFGMAGYQFHAGTVTCYELLFIALSYFSDDRDYRHALVDRLETFGRDELALVTNDPPDICIVPEYLLNGNWRRLHEIHAESDPQSRSVFFYFLAYPALAECFRLTGHEQNALQYIAEGFPNGPERSTKHSRFWFAQALEIQRTAAHLAMDQDDLDTARTWIDAHQAWIEWSDSVRSQSDHAFMESRFCLLAGDKQRAADIGANAVRHAENPRQPVALLRAHRAHGEALTSLDDHDAAAAGLTQSLDLANACHAPYERAITEIALAELHINAGDSELARNRLHNAQRTLNNLGARPALERIQIVRAKLGTAAQGPLSNANGLSSREIEVLGLVAEGLTDRQIGERLYISPRTVGQHLRSIFNKLEVNSRTAAAVQGSELGLLEQADR